MRIELDLDSKHNDTSVTIHAKEWSNQVESFIKHVHDYQEPTTQRRIIAETDDSSIVLEPKTIDYIVAEERKVFAVFAGERAEIKQKLYELEEQLASHQFIRFSKSVLGNLNQIERFEVSFNGNLCVFFKSGEKEYVSRKYVKPLRQKLLEG
ncbi:LytTR family DNA-binding domain-containing protein [Geomicrobium sp. JCM 19038]|uniref:LytTR family DNA-binding domain-containing protein n=1 Tax=Geomicrobium sp. JCM 19038 TaxID=1460635 RepID=UPI00045F141E|nr:LytTR family DNA-binding domain-containing protein [Geomicrobium sp. JCM 19038]GAK07174.1 response regulator [Geomicrobium sp. JCM 19038]